MTSLPSTNDLLGFIMYSLQELGRLLAQLTFAEWLFFSPALPIMYICGYRLRRLSLVRHNWLLILSYALITIGVGLSFAYRDLGVALQKWGVLLALVLTLPKWKNGVPDKFHKDNFFFKDGHFRFFKS